MTESPKDFHTEERPESGLELVPSLGLVYFPAEVGITTRPELHQVRPRPSRGQAQSLTSGDQILLKGHHRLRRSQHKKRGATMSAERIFKSLKVSLGERHTLDSHRLFFPLPLATYRVVFFFLPISRSIRVSISCRVIDRISSSR
ncbi:hypothetical protein [Pseudomonas asplenii]|uniref:hypothetical protein n=1 Tax=Pseudomonas asplenii TaxID=53407 RepID=UPI0006B661A7|nr:hypothetical protein [Pseudomonas fuscovaginae]